MRGGQSARHQVSAQRSPAALVGSDRIDAELLDYYTNLVRDVDLLVFGRKTYQLMVRQGSRKKYENRSYAASRRNS